jgi:teichuronic acid biosynthesis glycosyltransferase TuaH
LLIPFGCDADLYADVENARLPTDVDVPPPIVGFVGYIGSRIDFDLMEAVARRGRSLLLVGPRHWKFDIDRVNHLLALPNVCWVGAKPFEELPSYQRLIDVGIVPYLDSQFNRGSFPLKTLEYLGAGRAAVTTDLPAMRWLGTDLITIAEAGAEPFADAVDEALFSERTPELMARRQEFAAQHGWDKRAAQFAALIDGSRDRSAG